MFTSNTSNTNIIRPIFDNQNEAIQVLNPQPRVPKISGDSNDTKNLFNLWSHSLKHLKSHESHMWKLKCILPLAPN